MASDLLDVKRAILKQAILDLPGRADYPGLDQDIARHSEADLDVLLWEHGITPPRPPGPPRAEGAFQGLGVG